MRTSQTATLVTVLLAVLMFPFTLTGAAIALPDIRDAMHADLAEVQWVVNGYNTTFAGFMLAAGGLADRFGRRRVFAAGTAVFAVGGLVSAIVSDIVLLDVARAVSGIGGSAAAASGMAVLAGTFEGAAKARAFSLFGATIGLGLAFGPSVAGLLLTSLGWRSVFWLPALVGAGVLLLVGYLPEGRDPAARRIDWAGTVTFTGGLLLLIFGFVEGPALGWGSAAVVGAFAGAVVLLVGFVVIERRIAEPMFDFDLLLTKGFVGASLAAAALVGVLVPLLVYLPSYFTSVIGMSPQRAGATMILLTAPILVFPLISGGLTRWVRPATLILASLVLVGVGALWLTTISSTSAALSLAGPLLTIGVGLGMSTGLVDNMALSSVRPNRSGVAAGMFGTSRLAFETIAMAVIGSILAGGTAGTLAGPGYTGSLRTALWLLTGMIVLATVAFVALNRRPAGDPAEPAVSVGVG